jgi:ribulose-5-phosphate 4-epimerase/fuculose-1-phosphate aldolase
MSSAMIDRRASGAGGHNFDPVREARLDLVVAFRYSVRYGLHEGTDNHFSMAVPGHPDHYFINPHGPHFGEIKASDLLIVNGKGELVEGKYSIEPTAFFIHSRIHRARPSAACVMHTHMPYATALTAVEGGRLEACSQNALRFYEDVGYDDDSGYQGLALDDAEGDRMVAALGNKRIVFLANHGVICTGPNVAQTFDDVYFLERAAQVQVLAMSTGKPLKIVPHDIATLTKEQMPGKDHLYARVHLAALRRILEREEPDFMD